MARWPHDDPAALSAFYGKPGNESNLVIVKPPWQMTYEGRPIKGVRVHRKCAESLKRVFNDIAEQVDNDWDRLPPGALKFSGSYNFRKKRGGSNYSVHAYGAAIDMDAEANPMNNRGYKGTMSPVVINAFKREGWDWGGDWKSSKDPMHFQAAYTSRQVASLDESIGIAELPPNTDGHDRDLTVADASIGDRLGTAAGIVGTTSEIVGNAANIKETIKPITKSRISWGATALGATSTATAVANAPPSLLDDFIQIWKSPIWWLVLFNITLTVWIVWHYWRDHGFGRLKKGETE